MVTAGIMRRWNGSSSLKREWTGDRLYKTRQAAIADVREYVTVYYMPHSTLGYKTPMDYEKIAVTKCRKAIIAPRIFHT